MCWENCSFFSKLPNFPTPVILTDRTPWTLEPVAGQRTAGRSWDKSGMLCFFLKYIYYIYVLYIYPKIICWAMYFKNNINSKIVSVTIFGHKLFRTTQPANIKGCMIWVHGSPTVRGSSLQHRWVSEDLASKRVDNRVALRLGGLACVIGVIDPPL